MYHLQRHTQRKTQDRPQNTSSIKTYIINVDPYQIKMDQYKFNEIFLS